MMIVVVLLLSLLFLLWWVTISYVVLCKLLLAMAIMQIDGRHQISIRQKCKKELCHSCI